MEIKTTKSFTLNEKEIKEAIRSYFIDKLEDKLEIKEEDIKLDASITIDEYLYDFTATLTLKNK